MTIKEAADTIRASVSAQEVASLYGYKPNRGGYIACPFHGEKTPSLKLHKSGWYCYGCNQGGSVIDFVMLHDGCGFHAAVKAIDDQLHMGLFDTSGASLMQSIRRKKLTSDFDKFKTETQSAINAAISLAEGHLLEWWGIYQDAYATPKTDRTAPQWTHMENARQWCLYYEEIIKELREQLEEVKAWRMSRQNPRSA